MRLLGGLVVGIAIAVLTACQSAPTGPGPLALNSQSAALAAIEPVFTAAQACWFGSRDRAFRDYRLANELDSYSGRPRFLLVPARSPEARPLLVVQAEGNPARVEAFGPLMQGGLGTRIGADLARWNGGDSGCGSAA